MIILNAFLIMCQNIQILYTIRGKMLSIQSHNKENKKKQINPSYAKLKQTGTLKCIHLFLHYWLVSSLEIINILEIKVTKTNLTGQGGFGYLYFQYYF